MALTLVTAPTFNPVTIDEAKDRLRISHEVEDVQISAMISSATRYVENELNWRLCTQTWKLLLDDWPTVTNQMTDDNDIIRLPYPPLQSVTHVKYYDTNNAQQTYVENTDYRVDTNSFPGRIESINGWASLYDRVNAIEIQYVCGYSSTASIDEDIKDALYLRLADLYEYRQNSLMLNSVTQNTVTSKDILSRYKLYNEPYADR